MTAPLVTGNRCITELFKKCKKYHNPTEDFDMPKK